MILYLMRHAHANPGTPDEKRGLSARGDKQIRLLAKFFRRTEAFEPTEIWHSPLRRSRQTARRLAARTGTAAPLIEVEELSPDYSVSKLALQIQRSPGPLAVVGHEPQCGKLVAHLLGTRPGTTLPLQKAAVIALENGPGGKWRICWWVTPSLLA